MTEFLDYQIKEGGYDRRIMPPVEDGKPLPIMVDILIESIDAISEIKMDFRNSWIINLITSKLFSTHSVTRSHRKLSITV